MVAMLPWKSDDVQGTGMGAIDTRFLLFVNSDVLWSVITKSSVAVFTSLILVSLLNLCGHVFLSLVFFLRRKHVDGQIHKSTLTKQKNSPIAIKVGPINRSSNVLKPFSPLPTKEMTSPIADVPRPT